MSWFECDNGEYENYIDWDIKREFYGKSSRSRRCCECGYTIPAREKHHLCEVLTTEIYGLDDESNWEFDAYITCLEGECDHEENSEPCATLPDFAKDVNIDRHDFVDGYAQLKYETKRFRQHHNCWEFARKLRKLGACQPFGTIDNQCEDEDGTDLYNEWQAIKNLNKGLKL